MDYSSSKLKEAQDFNRDLTLSSRHKEAQNCNGDRPPSVNPETLRRRLWDAESRIHDLERLVENQSDKIKSLELQLENQKSKESTSFDQDVIRYYETRCSNLEKMVLEMHRWFSDYDLVWVGEDEEEALENGMREATDQELEHFGPISSEADLDALVKAFPNGDDDDGDDLDDDSPRLDIFWFVNGLKITSYPLMPYDSAWGKQTLEEIREGFLPSRLQFDFPDGVDLQSRDRRSLFFEEKGDVHPSLREMQAKGLLPSLDHPSLEKAKTKTDFKPALVNSGKVRAKSPTSKYLARVPEVVIAKDGDIKRPREDLSKLLKPDGPPTRLSRSIPVRIRVYDRSDDNQLLRFHLQPQKSVDDVKALCAKKLGLKRSEFDRTYDVISDPEMRKWEMTSTELTSTRLRVWDDDDVCIGTSGWVRDVQDDAPIKDKLVCLHLRKK